MNARKRAIVEIDLMKREYEEDIKYHPRHLLSRIFRKRIPHLEYALKALRETVVELEWTGCQEKYASFAEVGKRLNRTTEWVWTKVIKEGWVPYVQIGFADRGPSRKYGLMERDIKTLEKLRRPWRRER